MIAQPITTTLYFIRPTVEVTLTSTIPLEERELRPSLTDVLGHEPNGNAAPQALLAAAKVFRPLRARLGYDWRSAVSQSGEATLTFIRGRRYAVLCADEEGELVLTLTDRASNEEAEAEVVVPDVEDLRARIRRFLED
jgi:hypothetical protein